MAIPTRHTCHLNAAAEAKAATAIEPGGSATWAIAHALTGLLWLQLAAAQDDPINPEDAATWTPLDGDSPLP